MLTWWYWSTGSPYSTWNIQRSLEDKPACKAFLSKQRRYRSTWTCLCKWLLLVISYSILCEKPVKQPFYDWDDPPLLRPWSAPICTAQLSWSKEMVIQKKRVSAYPKHNRCLGRLTTSFPWKEQIDSPSSSQGAPLHQRIHYRHLEIRTTHCRFWGLK